MGRVAPADRSYVAGRGVLLRGRQLLHAAAAGAPQAVHGSPPADLGCRRLAGTFEKAARLGIGVLCFTLGTPDTLAPLIETYKKNIEKAEPVGDYVNNNIMVTGDMLCLEDGDRARRLFAANKSNYHTGLVFKYLDSFPRPPGMPVWPELPPEPTEAELLAGTNAAASCVGDPDEIARTIQRFIDVGADQLTFSSTVCDYDFDVLRESYDLFGKHLVPRFDTDPVHSTSHASVKPRSGRPTAHGKPVAARRGRSLMVQVPVPHDTA